jgi:hypothetical protein
VRFAVNRRFDFMSLQWLHCRHEIASAICMQIAYEIAHEIAHVTMHAAPYADLGCRMQKHRPLAPGMVRSPLPLITEPNVAWLWWLIKWAPVCSTSSNSARQISYLLGHLSKIQSTNQARRCLTLVKKCIFVCLTLSNSTQHTCHLVLRGPSTRAILSTNLGTIRCAIW